MKKILFVILGVMLAFALALSVSAEGVDTEAGSVTEAQVGTEADAQREEDDAFDLKSYLTEKVVPVAVGVLTSIVALMGTVAKVKSSLVTLDSSSKGLKERRETVGSTLKSVKEELDSGIAEIKGSVEAIPQIKEGYKELAEGYEALKNQSRQLMEAIKAGFEAMPDAVEKGAVRKIAILTEKSREEE